MYPDKYKEVAIKYHVEEIASTLIPGSRLSNILEELELGKPLSSFTQEFLSRKGFWALLRYAKKEITFTEFSKTAEIEQVERRLVAEANTLKEQVEQKIKKEALLTKQKLEEDALFIRLKIAREREAAKRRAFENDPKNIAKAKQLQLKQKYGISFFIGNKDFVKLMDILHRVDNGVRLSGDEIFWLSTKHEECYTGYFTEELREGFHKNEALFYVSEFKKNKDPWSAVNASSHYRKCKQAKTAETILSMIDASDLKNRKLQSALCTTHGGVKRDLRKWDEALSLGMQAHEFIPQDFRPCTLIGAIYMETGHYDQGQSWYKKAVERGYSEKLMDNELRVIFMRTEKPKQEAMRDHLLNIDPERYSWTNKKR